jgi:hypothetical protein
MIRTLQPYRRGNNLLWSLHHVKRRDKHGTGLVPINLRLATTVSSIGVLRGQLPTVGFREGRHLVYSRNKLSQPDPERQPIVVQAGDFGWNRPTPGIMFESNIGAGDDDMEVATAMPGTEFYADFQPSFDVAFRKVEGFEREPIVAVLHKMCQLVERVLLTFESRFFS